MRNGVWTLEELLGTLLVVVAIIVIGIFAKNLFESYTKQNENNAQAFVNSLSAKIENLEDGESNTFALVSVSGWILSAWSKDVPIASGSDIIGKDRKPQKCFDKSCLCLCEKSITNCQQVSYCRYFDRNIEVSSEYKYKFPQGQSIKSDFVSCYIMNQQSNLIPFFVKKEKSGISISGPISYVSVFDEIQFVKNTCNLGRDLSFS
ncbi:MAG: hypothetical protein AABX23_03295 [Nanoarchaeota archaeon]